MSWSFNWGGVSIGNATPEAMADNWVLANTNTNFSGTTADLQALINQQCNDCASSVHGSAQGVSTATAYGLCQSRLNNAYAAKMNALQGAQEKLVAATDTAAINSLSSLFPSATPGTAGLPVSQNTIIIAVVLLIILFLIFS